MKLKKRTNSVLDANMIRTLWSTLLIGMVLAMVRCAPTVKELNVAYLPAEPLTVTKVEVKSAKRIKVEPFGDKRLDVDIAEIPGAYGYSTGKYVAKNDVAGVFTDAVKTELVNQGYQIVQDNENFVLHGAVLALEVEVRHAPFGFYGMLEGATQARVEVKNLQEDKIVWSDIINGKSELKFTFAATEKKYEETIGLAIGDFVNNLVKSEPLQKCLE